MTNDEFAKCDDELLKSSNSVLRERESSYAEEGDRLANFKRIAQETGLTPEKVCEVYLHKALCSVTKLMNGQEVKGEPTVSRFSDVLNYVRLAYALYMEKHPYTSDQAARRGRAQSVDHYKDLQKYWDDYMRERGVVGQMIKPGIVYVSDTMTRNLP